MNTQISILLLATIFVVLDAFTIPISPMSPSFGVQKKNQRQFQKTLNFLSQKMSTTDENEEGTGSGVVELMDEDDDDKIESSGADNVPATPFAPFLSQGEISEEALNPDLSDPKQTRVIIYIILSLIPVLFLIPLMLGSRDLIPLDALPPVEM